MGAELLTEHYKNQIAGLLSFTTGSSFKARCCYAAGMISFLYPYQIRVFDDPKWAERLRDAIRENMERIAAENGIRSRFR